MPHKFIKLVIFNILFLMNNSAISKEAILEPDSWAFPSVIESARKISPENIDGMKFDRFGLAYSLQVLTNLDVANLSAEQLQKYADIVTHAYPDAVAKQLPSNCSNIQIENINATNFTNIAYVSLHAQNKKTRQGAKECLANLQSRFKKKK